MRNTGFPLQPRNLSSCIDPRCSLIAITNPGYDSLINAPSEHEAIGGKDSV